MSPDERRDEIVRLLSADGHGMTLATISGELGVTMRTIERDIAFLREHGYQIESHRGRSGGIRIIAPPPTRLDGGVRTVDTSPRPMSGAFGRVFVGRRSQMAQLRDALGQTATGRGGVILISGEAGIGKTRTLQELASYAEAAGFQVHWARCPEDRGAPPYWPWSQVIRSIVNGAGTDGLILGATPFPEQLRAIAPGVAFKQAAESQPSTAAFVSELTPEQVRFQTDAAVSGLLRQSSSIAPVLILIEDVHNGDSASLRLTELLARDLVDAPVLIAGTFREREFEPGHPLGMMLGNIASLPNFERVQLRGLGRSEIAELVRELTGVRPAPGRLTDIFERTNGNPFFVSEVAREPADLSQTSDIGRPLPRNVRDAIGVRLDALSTDTGDFLSTTALIGREFDPAVVRLANPDMSASLLMGSLDEAIAHRLLERGDELGIFRFTHDLVRETVVARVPSGIRPEAHLNIGDALERFYGDRADEHADELAHHYGEAGDLADPVRAFDYSLAAGLSALKMSAYFDAYGFLRTAVDNFGERPMDDRGAEAYFALGRTQEAVGVALRVSHLDAAKSLRTAFDYYVDSGNADGVVAIAGRPYMAVLTQAMGDTFIRALEFAAPDSHDMGRILVAEAYSRWIRTHDIAECLEQLDRVSEIAREFRDPELARRAVAVTANVAGMAGAWERANEAADSALAMHTGAPDTDSEIRSHIWRSNSLLALGRGAAAVQATEEYMAWAGGVQNPFARSTALTVASLASSAVGNWGRVFELSVESSHIRALDIPLLRAVVLASYATGEFESGRGFLEELIRKSREDGPGHPAMRIYGGYSIEAVDFAGRVAGQDAVYDLIDDAIHVARENSPQTQLADASRVGWSALMALHSGDDGEMKRTYSDLSALEAPFDPSGFSVARACALLARKLGLDREADACMERAISDTRVAGYLPDFALTGLEYAEELSHRSRPDMSVIGVLVEQGLAAARAVGMTPLVDRLESMRNSLGPVAPVELPAGLTGREVEVLRLIASGRTNRQIADELIISEFTVMRHVSNIYSKIDASNRAEATAFAIRSRLSPE